jgi:hypothetical protein
MHGMTNGHTLARRERGGMPQTNGRIWNVRTSWANQWRDCMCERISRCSEVRFVVAMVTRSSARCCASWSPPQGPGPVATPKATLVEPMWARCSPWTSLTICRGSLINTTVRQARDTTYADPLHLLDDAHSVRGRFELRGDRCGCLRRLTATSDRRRAHTDELLRRWQVGHHGVRWSWSRPGHLPSGR